MSILNNILLMLYPRRCSVCGKVIVPNGYFCDECQKLIVYNEKLCIKCGGEKGKCRCERSTFRFRGCVAPILNDKDGAAMKCIYNYKMHDNGEIADLFAALITAQIKKHYADIKFDAITWVPVAFTKADRKGYDHSELLARKISKFTNIKCENLLIKSTSHIQHKMGRKERFESVYGVFKANGRNDYKNVLLIDDLITTGATLNECAKELMFAGTQNVYCAAAVSVGLEKQTTNGYNENGEEK